MDNQRIAEIFQEIGDMLDIQGENRFRILAYRRAAENILSLPYDLKDLYQKDPQKLQEIPGIGKDLANKIIELVTVGKCEYYEKMLKAFPQGLLQILRVRGVGPKKVKLFFAELQIDSIEKLREAAEKNMLQTLPGMGPKSEAEILKSLSEYDRHIERMTLDKALHEAEKLLTYLRKFPLCQRVEYAGSLRRMKETIGDIDILVNCKEAQSTPGTKDTVRAENVAKIMEYFAAYPETVEVLNQGTTKTSVVLRSGVQADLRVIDEKSFGAAMHYFTGSKEHNIVVRDRAKKKGLKVNEYGVFQLKKVAGQDEPQEILIGGATEEEVFKSVDLPFIPPEMRENRGEFEAADEDRFPKLIELKDLRGDLHVHSKWSDGNNEIGDIARAYRAAEFDYIALTDHSPAVAVAHGLTSERFELQWAEIDELNRELAEEAGKIIDGKKVPPFVILKGVECDIMADGSLDLPDSVLKKMDVVVASVHSRFNLPEKEQTARVLKAFQNPYVKIFGHPSGRLINQREPYSIDMEKIIAEAIEQRIALEIDGQPSRLDLFDFYCQMAKSRGAKFTIDSDSHDIVQRVYLNYGIGVARRGWIEKKDVLNAMRLAELRKWWKN